MITMMLLALWMALHAADCWTTMRILARPGGFEKNPLLVRAMARFGVTATLAAKFVLAGVLAALGLLLMGDRLAFALVPACLFYVWIVASNVRVLRKLLK